MSVINPEFAEKPFQYSFKSVNYNHKPVKLKSVKLEKENFKKIEKIFETLGELKGKKWSDVLGSEILYSGNQAKPIKEEKDKALRDIIKNAFADHEADYSETVKYYPSYLSITKEIRLFGYQWKGIFNIVLVDLNHIMHKR